MSSDLILRSLISFQYYVPVLSNSLNTANQRLDRVEASWTTVEGLVETVTSSAQGLHTQVEGLLYYTRKVPPYSVCGG